MHSNSSNDKPEGKRDARSSDGLQAMFTTTNWSMIMTVNQGDPARSAAALEELCRRYWSPLYVYIRRRGHDRHSAEDLTQAFFAHILDMETLKRVDRSKGRFRGFLLGVLKHFLLNESDKRGAQKRGGGMQVIPFDEAQAELVYQRESKDNASPEKLYDRRWAHNVMETALERLQRENSVGKKAEAFKVLEPCLTGETETGWLREASAKLSWNEGATRVALHRLRRRYGDLLRDEISQTVSTSEEVEDELRQMFASLG